MIKNILKPGRIIANIAVSVTNDESCQEKNEGLKVFGHRIPFDQVEIDLLYPPEDMARKEWNQLEYATGRVPWYIDRWANNPQRHYYYGWVIARNVLVRRIL